MPVRVIHPPGGAAGAWASDFQAQLVKQYAALKVPCPPTATDLAAAKDDPEFLIYFATAPWDGAADPAFAEALRVYADEAVHLLPVIDREPDAGSHLAPALQRFNAFIAGRYPKVFAEALVDEALTLLWQRRRQRRIFISYKRAESQAMARQLHEHFSQRSFAVFLDERSIEPAADFQHELRRHLDDSDAVLVLVSPDLMTSQWVREELEFAKTRSIGLLGIVWPNDGKVAPEIPELDRDQRVELAGSPPVAVDRTLTDTELDLVDRMMFEGRSKVIARRTTSLIDEVVPTVAPDFKLMAARSDGDLDLERAGQPWLGRIAPFRPSPYDLWRWWDQVRRRSTPPEGILVLYPHVDPSDPTEAAFRAVCEAWGERARPQVELRAVRVAPTAGRPVGGRKRVFLSASVPTGRVYPRSATHLETGRPHLIRDAVLAVVREGLRSGFDFVFGAHPSIAPMVLTVAREFPSPSPRIHVFLSRFFEKVFPQETLELADGKLGTLTLVDEVPGDREASLLAMRREMLALSGLAGAIVVGGMNGVTEEATMFLDYHQRSLPLYAFGSTGAAALDLFDLPPPGFSPDEFTGGAVAPVSRDLLCEPVPGYARVARAIFRAMGPSGT